MAERDDRVSVGERVVWEHDLDDAFCIKGNFACQIEHGRRCVSRHNAMSCLEQVAGKEAAPTAELDDQALSFAYGLEPLQDPRRAYVGVEAKPSVMHEREIRAVVGGIGCHQIMMPARLRGGSPPSATVLR